MSNTNGNLPRPDSPIMLPDGRMSPEWWAFFLAIFNRTGGPGSPIGINSLKKQDEISQDVPPQNAATMMALQGVNDLWSEQAPTVNLSAIYSRLDALEHAIQHSADLSRIMTRLEELEGFQNPSPDSSRNIFRQITPAATLANGSATTVYSIPSGATAAWMVHAHFNFVTNDTKNYSAFAVIVSDGSAARVALSSNASLMTITVSGLNIQVKQSSGAAQSVSTSVIKVG